MTPAPQHGLPEPLPATGTPGHRLRHGAAPRPQRRRSVPARPRGRARVPGGAVAAPPPLALRLGRTARRVGDARLLDRLVRGRGWIALIAVGLMGIVFTQVSLLKLNAGISRAVSASDALERQNATLRAQISSLDSGERIQDVAARLGMLMPAAGQVRFLDARDASAARAAASIHPPDPVTTILPAATTTAPAPTAPAPAATTTPATAATPTATTPAPTAPSTTTTPAPTATTTAPPPAATTTSTGQG